MEEIDGELNNYWETDMFFQNEELDSYLDEAFYSYCDTLSSDGASASKNIDSERNRRRKLNEKLYALRSVVPNITKLDKASIVKDAIEYIKSLQKDERRLETEISGLESGKLSPSNSIFDTTSCSNPKGQRAENSRDSEKTKSIMTSPIEVLELRVSHMGDSTLVVSLTCTESTYAIVKLCKMFESLKLRIITSNITSYSGKLLKTVFVEAAGKDGEYLRVQIEAAIADLNDPNSL